jgi:altronate dehydratase small subunit
MGERVARAGMSIGSATTAVLAGEWVHTHNLASDYLATFAHRGGER